MFLFQEICKQKEKEREIVMSSTQTSQVISKQRGVSKRLWGVGLLTLLAAVIVNALIALVARALFPVAPTFIPLQLGSVIVFTVIGVVGAIIVFALLMRWTKHPVRLFQRIALVVLLASLIPDLLLPFVGLFSGTTLPGVGALLLMHVATGLICLGILPRAKY
jgi:ABC-type anion transport system duplicated permease subunit